WLASHPAGGTPRSSGSRAWCAASSSAASCSRWPWRSKGCARGTPTRPSSPPFPPPTRTWCDYGPRCDGQAACIALRWVEGVSCSDKVENRSRGRYIPQGQHQRGEKAMVSLPEFIYGTDGNDELVLDANLGMGPGTLIGLLGNDTYVILGQPQAFVI